MDSDGRFFRRRWPLWGRILMHNITCDLCCYSRSVVCVSVCLSLTACVSVGCSREGEPTLYGTVIWQSVHDLFVLSPLFHCSNCAGMCVCSIVYLTSHHPCLHEAAACQLLINEYVMRYVKIIRNSAVSDKEQHMLLLAQLGRLLGHNE